MMPMSRPPRLTVINAAMPFRIWQEHAKTLFFNFLKEMKQRLEPSEPNRNKAKKRVFSFLSFFPPFATNFEIIQNFIFGVTDLWGRYGVHPVERVHHIVNHNRHRVCKVKHIWWNSPRIVSFFMSQSIFLCLLGLVRVSCSGHQQHILLISTQLKSVLVQQWIGSERESELLLELSHSCLWSASPTGWVVRSCLWFRIGHGVLTIQKRFSKHKEIQGIVHSNLLEYC